MARVKDAKWSLCQQWLTFGLLATRNYHPSYVKHVSGRIDVFCTLFGYFVCYGGVGGSPNGLVHNLVVQFFTLCSLQIEISKTYCL